MARGPSLVSLCFLWASDHLIVTEEGDRIDINQQTMGKYTFEENWEGYSLCMDIMRKHQLAVVGTDKGEMCVIDLRTEKLIQSDQLHIEMVLQV